MNIQEIERLWKIAKDDPHHDTNWHDPAVVKFAELVAQHERKACADLLMGLHQTQVGNHNYYHYAANAIEELRGST